MLLSFTKKSKLVRMAREKENDQLKSTNMMCSVFFQVCENGLNNIPKI